MPSSFASRRTATQIKRDDMAKYYIDPEFKRLLPELSETELEYLEANIIQDGCRDPIVVWNNLIVDGHHRYEICRRHRISFKTESLHFSCREEVLRWICVNQMGRRNVSPELLRYQIGKRYNVEKVLSAHNPRGRNQYTEVASDVLMRPPTERRMGTAATIGKAYNLSHFAVHSYKDIATAIDTSANIEECLKVADVDMYNTKRKHKEER